MSQERLDDHSVERRSTNSGVVVEEDDAEVFLASEKGIHELLDRREGHEFIITIGGDEVLEDHGDVALEGIELLVQAEVVVVAGIHGMDLITPYAQDPWYSMTREEMDRRREIRGGHRGCDQMRR